MKKVAVLIDGEFFSLTLRRILGLTGRPTAAQVHKNAILMTKPTEEEILRIFYYDSTPFDGTDTHPITRARIDYNGSRQATARRRFLSEIGQMDLVALRCGVTRPRGWQFTEAYLRQIRPGAPIPTPSAADYEQRFEQKGVDMRIGIDVATLSLNKYVDRIIVASNDTDLIPAFKVARRHGVQVVIAEIGTNRPHKDLVEDSDFKRPMTPVA